MKAGTKRRLQRMMAVESNYFNRPGGISGLIAITYAMLFFTFVFCEFYLISRDYSAINESYVRASLYLMAGYFLCYVIYKVACRHKGLTYGIVMLMTSLSFATAAISGYMIFRCMWSWQFNDMILDPRGYTPILDQIVYYGLYFAAATLVIYVIAMFIPAKTSRPVFGKVWPLMLVSQVVALAAALVVVVALPEERQIGAAGWVCVVYFCIVMWLAVRYCVKAVVYLIIQNERRETIIEELEGEPAVPVSDALSKEDIAEAIKQNVERKTAADEREIRREATEAEGENSVKQVFDKTRGAIAGLFAKKKADEAAETQQAEPAAVENDETEQPAEQSKPKKWFGKKEKPADETGEQATELIAEQAQEQTEQQPEPIAEDSAEPQQDAQSDGPGSAMQEPEPTPEPELPEQRGEGEEDSEPEIPDANDALKASDEPLTAEEVAVLEAEQQNEQTAHDAEAEPEQAEALKASDEPFSADEMAALEEVQQTEAKPPEQPKPKKKKNSNRKKQRQKQQGRGDEPEQAQEQQPQEQ